MVVARLEYYIAKALESIVDAFLIPWVKKTISAKGSEFEKSQSCFILLLDWNTKAINKVEFEKIFILEISSSFNKKTMKFVKRGSAYNEQR